MRFLHTSDCHVGTEPRPAAQERALARLATRATAPDIDALVIAGDLFDSPRVARTTVIWTARTLTGTGKPAVILPGNHDPATAHSLWDTFRQAAGHEVHVLDGEAITTRGVTFWGRPTHTHEPAFRPLRDVPTRPDGACVALAHGLVTGDPDTRRGSPILPEDLAALDWDYVALGHWPTARRIDAPVPVHYSGEYFSTGAALEVQLNQRKIVSATQPGFSPPSTSTVVRIFT